jgi:uncharacterized lipoprotein YehR (DUF1307 family)
MKKLTKVLALAIVVAMACLALASCGKTLSGTYTAELDVGIAGAKTSYTFKGSKVTVTKTGSLFGAQNTTEYEGKYVITEAKDGSMTITFTFEDSDAKEYTGEYKFAEDKDAKTITIGVVTYTKAD